jgi:hypothetical protein
MRRIKIMSIEAFVHSFLTKDYHTEIADTAIVETLDGKDGLRLVLKAMNYLAAGTAHTASFMYAEDAAGQTGSSRNTASAAALSGQHHITCTTAPKDPAGNAAAASDIIAFQLTDGTWEWDTVAALAGSIIECTNNITGVDAGAGGTAIAAGGKVLIFGVVGDNKSQKLGLTASVVTKGDELAIVQPYVGEPMYLSINNATAAGFLNSLVMAYINK